MRGCRVNWVASTIFGGALAAWTPFVFPRAALAQEAQNNPDSIPVTLSYDASDACPGSRAFETQVRARSRLIEFQPDAQVLRVRVTRAPDGTYLGDASIPAPDSDQPVRRRVQDQSCEDVVSALAFITVVTLDPLAVSTPSAPPPSPPPPEPVPDEPVADEAPDEPSPASKPWALQLGLQGTLNWSPAPEMMPAAGIFLQSGIDPHAETLQLSFAGRLGITASAPTTTLLSAGLVQPVQSEFSLYAAQLDLCALRYRWVSACAGLELGLLRAGSDSSPEIQSRLWVAVHPAVQLDIPVAGRWLAQLRGGATAPLRRDRFVVDISELNMVRSVEVHQPPYAALFVGLGLAYSLTPAR